MRIVILSSSLYSETASAAALRMAELGYIPVGAVALRTLDHRTLLRKVGQWGTRGVTKYARNQLVPSRKNRFPVVNNPYLEPLLKRGDRVFRNLREVAALHAFPTVVCNDQNAASSIAQLKAWSPDLILFTGGNILRKPVLDVPRLGVLNVHLASLPEIRGMSSPEWSLLQNVPVGITIHYMDTGIDTGPILQKYELPDAARSESLSDLRNRLIAFGIEKIGEVVVALDRGAVSEIPQPHDHKDNQFFVIHEFLKARAVERLVTSHQSAGALSE
jgi:folate-dependent phosphoribosylglycinamide formyltransferase PurN